QASFSDGPPGTSAMISSAMCGGARPFCTTRLCERFPAGGRNIGHSRIFGTAGFFGSVTAQLQTQKCHPHSPYPISLLAVQERHAGQAAGSARTDQVDGVARLERRQLRSFPDGIIYLIDTVGQCQSAPLQHHLVRMVHAPHSELSEATY